MIRSTVVIAAAAAFFGCGTETTPDSGQVPPVTDDAGVATQVSDSELAGETPVDCGDEPEIAGLCLGMTRSQVEAALLAYDPSAQILRERMSMFQYSDGVNQLATDRFLYSLSAHIPTNNDSYTIFFTPPPGEPRAVEIQRQLSSNSNLPTVDAYIEAMAGKYGPSTATGSTTAPNNYRAGARWEFPEGQVVCHNGNFEEAVGIAHQLTPLPGDGIANLLSRQGFDDPSQCAKLLQADLYGPSPSEAAASATIKLTDIGAASEAEIAALEWVDSLEAQAKADRLKNAEAPRL